MRGQKKSLTIWCYMVGGLFVGTVWKGSSMRSLLAPPYIRAESSCSRELQADVWEEELVKMRIL